MHEVSEQTNEARGTGRPRMWQVTGATVALVAAGLLSSTGTAAADSSVMGSTCRTHNPYGNSSVTVCRTYESDGHGAYKGTWTITKRTGDAEAQGRFDGISGSLAPTGHYSGVHSFVTRGCSGSVCTDWS